MKNMIFAAVTAAFMAVPALAQQDQGFGPLIAAEELAEVKDSVEPLILDIRMGEVDGKPAYEAGHIEGAVFAPYRMFRGPDENPGQLPSNEELTQNFRLWGVEQDRPTVIVHQGNDETDFGGAARVYWTLKSAGVSEIAIINGGMNAWVKAGLPTTTEAYTEFPSDITVEISDQWLATQEEILAIVEGQDTGLLLDSRPEAFWTGDAAHAAAARPGTLPQSQYFTHSRWFSDDPSLIDVAAVTRLVEENGYTGQDQLVSFCNTGHWAATNWFVLSELGGVENVKLYPESMVGWSNAGLPMDNVPGPLKNLWKQVTSIF
ncbi:sulfurtransferase [Halovulum dunhuangense]|uniref:Sulfurtransferase n=1 Tax=Halovulum dunhuangense TaxID=1505036 RepID=A0A849L237_9RHOB|nr:rhodanese-like domain-containing protein [Halovulum dunhuangense]NNU80287.1 sulfurtransferase [Halovulum dunhuangense]